MLPVGTCSPYEKAPNRKFPHDTVQQATCTLPIPDELALNLRNRKNFVIAQLPEFLNRVTFNCDALHVTVAKI